MTTDWTRRGFIGAAGAVLVAGAGTAATSAAPTAETLQAPPIKILGISGSPRQGKTTAAGLQVCLDAAKKVAANIEVELIELAGLRIDGSLAAGVEPQPDQRDDFPQLVPKLSDPKLAGIIIGTPVYFGSMTSLCKAFLERCTVLRKKNDYVLSNKVAGVLTVGGMRNGGQELTIQCVQAALLCHEMLVVGDGRPTGHRGATLWNNGKDDISGDEFGLSTARNLGRRVAEVALRMIARSAST